MKYSTIEVTGDVKIGSGGKTYEGEYVVTPSSAEQVLETAGFTLANDVVVEAIPSEYVDTSDANATANDILSNKTAYVDGAKITGEIPVRYSSDVTVSGADVTVTKGYYGSNVTKTIPSGSISSPTFYDDFSQEANTVHVYASYDVNSGYMVGGTYVRGNHVITASQLVSGTQNITQNGTTDITNFKYVNVNVPNPSTGSLSITSNNTYDVTNYASAVVNVPNPSTGSISITSNNTYDVTNYASAVVNVPNPSTGTISITSNGTVDVTNYASADVSVSGGNGYGGDGTWSRPMDMPKLDDMDISGGDVVYLTYGANEVEGFCNISIERSSGNIVVDFGHIQNGSFVVEDTDTYTSNTTYKKYFGSPSGTYKVIRISGLITKLGFVRNQWTTFDGVYRESGQQGIIEVYGKLPHLTSFTSYGVGRIQAVHLGNAPLTNMDSMFYGDAHLESVDSRNWDVSNCTSMKYTFNDTRSLFKLDVSNWNTSKVTNCQATFLNSNVEVLDISNWDMSLVTNTTQFMQGTRQLSITVPASLDNISANAFNSSDRGVLEYHFKATTPPTLANTNAFNGIKSQAKIYVPSASLTTYQGASNWSNYSTYMVGE